MEKTDKIKEGKIKENTMKDNARWNYWKFQLHWNNLEKVDSHPKIIKENQLYSSTCKFYIKYGK